VISDAFDLPARHVDQGFTQIDQGIDGWLEIRVGHDDIPYGMKILGRQLTPGSAHQQVMLKKMRDRHK
jgi:hypothetical protein